MITSQQPLRYKRQLNSERVLQQASSFHQLPKVYPRQIQVKYQYPIIQKNISQCEISQDELKKMFEQQQREKKKQLNEQKQLQHFPSQKQLIHIPLPTEKRSQKSIGFYQQQFENSLYHQIVAKKQQNLQTSQSFRSEATQCELPLEKKNCSKHCISVNKFETNLQQSYGSEASQCKQHKQSYFNNSLLLKQVRSLFSNLQQTPIEQQEKPRTTMTQEQLRELYQQQQQTKRLKTQEI